MLPKKPKENQSPNAPQTAMKSSSQRAQQLTQQLNAWVRQNRFKEAEGVLHQLMVIDPENITYVKTAAFLKGRQGQPHEAAAILNDAIMDGTQDDEMVDLAIRANMQVGKFF